MKLLYSILVLLAVTSCNNRETKYDYFCGPLPSTPTDLIIINDTPEKLIISLLVNEGTLKRFGSVELGPNQEKQLCIENEGAIIKGLYLEFNGGQTKVTLNSLEVNNFYTSNRLLKQ
jgi:hypothetical protein